MKSLVIIIILFYQQQNVNAGFLKDFVTKINDFTVIIKDAFKTIGESLFAPASPTTNDQNIDEDDLVDIMTKRNVKQRFTDFLEAMVTEVQANTKNIQRVKFYPTAVLTTTMLAARHGRHVDTHMVYSRDGYLLTIHRLASKNTTKQTNRTVLLHHGLLGSSIDWILLGPEKSLPYILSDAGYDVWMANARGNYYSRGHVIFDVASPEYWDFSWHQMGEYDLPAVIDYVRQQKQTNETISYVGHSMGATALLVLLSTVPLYNQYIRIAILLAPLAFMTESKGPLKTLAKSPSERVLKVIGHKEFMPSRLIPDRVASKYCYGLKVHCRIPLLFLSGSVPSESNKNQNVMKLLVHVPARGSTKTILHFAQLTHTGKFHMYNEIASEYHLNLVTVPVVLFSSDDDWLSTPTDVYKLFFKISNPVGHNVIRGEEMKHTDFVWGPKAKVLIYNKVLEYMDNNLKPLFTNINEIDAKTD